MNLNTTVFLEHCGQESSNGARLCLLIIAKDDALVCQQFLDLSLMRLWWSKAAVDIGLLQEELLLLILSWLIVQHEIDYSMRKLLQSDRIDF